MDFRQCFFFDTHEVTKIVLPKVLQNFKKTPNCACWPKAMNQKSFTFFPKHTIPDETKGTPSIFLSFATEWMLKNPDSAKFLGFAGTVEENTLTRKYFDTLKFFCYF